MLNKDLLIQEAARIIAQHSRQRLSENEDNPFDWHYHVSVHQDLMTLASKERAFSNGAADYYRAAGEDVEKLKSLYATQILPILKKHGLPERMTPKMHDVQNKVMEMWRKVT